MVVPNVFANPGDWLEAKGYPSWGFKYVRFADGIVLFCDSADSSVSHQTVARSRPEVPPVFAGKIQIRHGKWCYKEGGSTTLKLPSGESDERYIEKALKPHGFEHDPDMRYSL